MISAFKFAYGSAALSTLLLVMASHRDAPSPAPAAPASTAPRSITTLRIAPPISAEQFEQRFAAVRQLEPAPALPELFPLMATIPPNIALTSATARVSHDDICQHGRRHYSIGRHRYWRCRRH